MKTAKKINWIELNWWINYFLLNFSPNDFRSFSFAILHKIWPRILCWNAFIVSLIHITINLVEQIVQFYHAVYIPNTRWKIICYFLNQIRMRAATYFQPFQEHMTKKNEHFVISFRLHGSRIEIRGYKRFSTILTMKSWRQLVGKIFFE